MKPRNIAIACGVAGVAVGLAAAAGIVYRKQIKSAASLKRLTGNADGYDLYAIDIAYDYDLDRIIAAGVRDDQAYIDAVVAQVLPGVRHPGSQRVPQLPSPARCALEGLPLLPNSHPVTHPSPGRPQTTGTPQAARAPHPAFTR